MNQIVSYLILFVVLFCQLPLNAQDRPPVTTVASPASWLMMNIGSIGYYYTSADYAEKLGHQFELFHFAFGFKKLGGIGFGLSAGEEVKIYSADFESYISSSSLVPLYIYLPLIMSVLPTRSEDFHSFYALANFGGSAWGDDQTKFYKGGIRGGYSYVVVAGNAVLPMGVYFQTGILKISTPMIEVLKPSFYFSFGITMRLGS